MFEVGLDANGICSVYQDAGMLGGDDRLDDGGKVVHVGQCLDTQDDIVVCIFTGGCLFGSTDNCKCRQTD